jgi:hypothetical protein
MGQAVRYWHIEFVEVDGPPRLEYHMGRDRQAVIERRSLRRAIDVNMTDPLKLAMEVDRWVCEIGMYDMVKARRA